jgi:hypothetical protein
VEGVPEEGGGVGEVADLGKGVSKGGHVTGGC